MIIEEFWNIITNFFTNLNSIVATFLAITLALLVQRIAYELGHENIDFIPNKNSRNFFIRMSNYFLRLCIAFLIGFIFFFIIFAILSIFSALSGFIINKF